MIGEVAKFKYSELLSVRRLPGRLLAEEVAVLLGFKPHDIPVLVKAGLLKPLASGPTNCVKYFFAEEIESLPKNRLFFEKATRAVMRGRNTATVKKVLPSTDTVAAKAA
jgi:hypothetical protein